MFKSLFCRNLTIGDLAKPGMSEKTTLTTLPNRDIGRLPTAGLECLDIFKSYCQLSIPRNSSISLITCRGSDLILELLKMMNLSRSNCFSQFCIEVPYIESTLRLSSDQAFSKVLQSRRFLSASPVFLTMFQ